MEQVANTSLCDHTQITCFCSSLFPLVAGFASVHLKYCLLTSPDRQPQSRVESLWTVRAFVFCSGRQQLQLRLSWRGARRRLPRPALQPWSASSGPAHQVEAPRGWGDPGTVEETVYSPSPKLRAKFSPQPLTFRLHAIDRRWNGMETYCEIPNCE